MNDIDRWPASVRAYLGEALGEPVAAERLGGMSMAAVYRVRAGDTARIVKSSPSPRETLLYEHGGEQLRRAGVPLPACHWSAHLDGTSWLVLEDIPDSVPLPHHLDWQPDPRMVEVLATIHALPLELPPALASLEGDHWTEERGELSLSFFAPEVADALRAPLQTLRLEAQHLAVPHRWIQGDTNAFNWGVRRDGTLALYDWERVRKGAPPVDLAILVQGMGDPAKYAALVREYVAACARIGQPVPWPVAALPRDIALAKAWVVMDLLAAYVSGAGRVPERLREQLAEFVPPWLRMVAEDR